MLYPNQKLPKPHTGLRVLVLSCFAYPFDTSNQFSTIDYCMSVLKALNDLTPLTVRIASVASKIQCDGNWAQLLNKKYKTTLELSRDIVISEPLKFLTNGFDEPGQAQIAQETALLEYARNQSKAVDLIIDLGHDPFSHYIEASCPVIHVPNLAVCGPRLNQAWQISLAKPNRFGLFSSKAQLRQMLGKSAEIQWSDKLTIKPQSVLFNQKKSYSPKAKKSDWVFAGRITQGKGLLALVKLARRHSKKLTVIGPCHSPADKVYLMHCRRHLPSLRYIGELDREKLLYSLGQHQEFFMLQSLDSSLCKSSEAFGRVTAEALMAGLNVRFCQTGANQEVVKQSGLSTGYCQQINRLGTPLKKLKKVPAYRKNRVRSNFDTAEKTSQWILEKTKTSTFQ